MAFRKRNVAIGRTTHSPGADSPDSTQNESLLSSPGTRPSPIDGRLTTSTGTASLDSITGHAGLPVGHAFLIEENGTTDYGGVLLKYFAAEGLSQRHKVLVVGLGEQWGRELPGIVTAEADDATKKIAKDRDPDKMKIAWRYESLGEFGASGRAPDRASPSNPAITENQPSVFCHTFDLTKRFNLPQENPITYIQLSSALAMSPFAPVLMMLSQSLSNSSSDIIHRLVIPAMLSPGLYPPHSTNPSHVLQFVHSLRSILRMHPNRLVVMLSIPLELHPRSSSLTRWLEHLCDGVLTLLPFPHDVSVAASSGAATQKEEKPQGLVKVLKVPIQTERGMGGMFGGEGGEDLAFTVSRKKFAIRAFSLPPVEGDEEGQRGGGEGGGLTGKEMEF
ncbi:MAG: hypothetical protein Q9165_005951 [Trypethelium subeluteriae]